MFLERTAALSLLLGRPVDWVYKVFAGFPCLHQTPFDIFFRFLGAVIRSNKTLVKELVDERARCD